MTEAVAVPAAEEAPVDAYPARPYGEAITAEHRAYLEEHGVPIK